MAEQLRPLPRQSEAAGAARQESGARGLNEQRVESQEKLVEMTTWADEFDDVTVPLILTESNEGIGSLENDILRSVERKFTAEEAIEHVGFGNYQILLVVYVGLTWMADAAEMILLSFIGPAAQCEWQLSPSQEGAVSSAVFAGIFVGAYGWGLLADTRGRRVAVFTTAVFTSVFGILSALSPSFWWLLISRALVGFGLGGTVVVFALVMEFLPMKRRGFWLVFLEFFWTIGSIGEALLAWAIIPHTNWRWLVAVSAIPFVLLLVFLPLVPESPKYMMVKGDVEGAMKILRQVAKTNGKVLPEGKLTPSLPFGGTATSILRTPTKKLKGKNQSALEEVENGEVKEISEHLKELGAWKTVKRLFAPELLRTTLLLWFLYLANSFVYYGLVLLTTQLDVKDGKGHTCHPSDSKHLLGQICYDGRPAYDDTQYRAVLISSIAEVPGVIVACLIVDLLGHKASLASLLIACGAFMVPLVTPLSELATNVLMFGARSCSMGGFSILWAFAPELYYTAVRSTGVGAANSQGRLGGFLCPYVAVGFLQSCQRVLSIGTFASISVLAGVATLFFPRIKVRRVPDKSSA